jgi:hypothetical protein
VKYFSLPVPFATSDLWLTACTKKIRNSNNARTRQNLFP